MDIEAAALVPFIYDLLRFDLDWHRYSVGVFPFDWRKNLDRAADLLHEQMARLMDTTTKPIHLIAHSQGALVARRALQKLRQDKGEDLVRQHLGHLVLLGPANYGTFSAAFALAGNHEWIQKFRPIVVKPEQGFRELMDSMSGLYQLLPWSPDRLPWLAQSEFDLGRKDFWQPAVDSKRLETFFRWGKEIDMVHFRISPASFQCWRPSSDGVRRLIPHSSTTAPPSSWETN